MEDSTSSEVFTENSPSLVIQLLDSALKYTQPESEWSQKITNLKNRCQSKMTDVIIEDIGNLYTKAKPVELYKPILFVATLAAAIEYVEKNPKAFELVEISSLPAIFGNGQNLKYTYNTNNDPQALFKQVFEKLYIIREKYYGYNSIASWLQIQAGVVPVLAVLSPKTKKRIQGNHLNNDNIKKEPSLLVKQREQLEKNESSANEFVNTNLAYQLIQQTLLIDKSENLKKFANELKTVNSEKQLYEKISNFLNNADISSVVYKLLSLSYVAAGIIYYNNLQLKQTKEEIDIDVEQLPLNFIAVSEDAPFQYSDEMKKLLTELRNLFVPFSTQYPKYNFITEWIDTQINTAPQLH